MVSDVFFGETPVLRVRSMTMLKPIIMTILMLTPTFQALANDDDHSKGTPCEDRANDLRDFVQPSPFFTANHGQLEKDVRFAARTGTVTAFFSPGRVTYRLTRSRCVASDTALPPDQQSHNTSSSDRLPESDGHTVRTVMLGCNPTASIVGEGILDHRSHFYIGDDPDQWKINVPNYRAVSYRNLYRGITLRYRSEHGKIEYDIIAEHGSDIAQVRILFEGIETLSISSEGDLEIETPFGTIVEKAPKAFQTKDGNQYPIHARYILLDPETLGFRIDGSYDHELPVTIDPVLIYSTYIGGSDSDHIHDIAYDTSGSAYVTGSSWSFDFPAFSGPVPGYLDPSIFVSKFLPDGTDLDYSVFIGGSAYECATGVAVDSSGCAYITGHTYSDDFPTTFGAFDRTFNPVSTENCDIFIAKLSSIGQLVYSTYLGGSSSDRAQRIALDSFDNAHIVGSTYSSNYPTTPGAFDTTINADCEVCVSRLTLFGGGYTDLLYSTFLGGDEHDEGFGIDVDASGQMFVCGSTESVNFPTTVGFPHQGSFDAFVVKIAPLGTGSNDLIFGTLLGGTDYDYGISLAINNSGQPFLTGMTWSADFYTTAGAFQTSFGGAKDGYVAKFSADGSTVIFSTFLGGANKDYCMDITISPNADPITTGYTYSNNFPVTYGSLDTSLNGRRDAFITMLSQNGTHLLYSTFFGGIAGDWGEGISADSNWNWYVAIHSDSDDILTTPGAFDTTYNRSCDCVIAKFGPLADPVYVPDDHALIQDALWACFPGDTIVVRPGIYNENIDFGGKAITLKSEKGPHETVIDGGQSGSVVTFESGEGADARIEGFTIRNGSGTYWLPYTDTVGGGIYCDSSSPTITGNIVSENQASVGGGIWAYSSSATVMSNIITMNMSSNVGGGIQCEGFASPIIVNNIIAHNAAIVGGGALVCYSQSTAVITNNTVTENLGGNIGGGLYCEDSFPLITNSIFWDNVATVGPEIYVASGDPAITFCNVKGGWPGGNLDAEPKFVESSSSDYHLCVDSPCLNAGSNSAAEILAFDFEGDPRIVPVITGNVDIGADEFFYHLYHTETCVVTPGDTVCLRVVGLPGQPVTLARGDRVLNPGVSSFKWKGFRFLDGIWGYWNSSTAQSIPPIPVSGVRDVVFRWPSNSAWSTAGEYPFQALVGPISNKSSALTNLIVFVVP